jgi:hypothetical protein
MTSMTSVRLLPDHPYVDSSLVDRVRRDYERLARGHWPHPIEEYLADEYALDVSTDYAGLPLRNPWGKASGQLSMTAAQVAEDVEAGLGFVVLKTVIAQDSAANQSMQEWAIRESRMSVERIVGRSGEPGWTTTWKGRGWWQPFDDYLNLVREARRLARAARTLIVPSCKFHLPAGSGEEWRMEEYDFTVNKLLEAWQSDDKLAVMPLEKDFSPTLAGSDRARQRGTILSWLRSVPRLIRAAAKKSGAGSAGTSVRVGLKVFNALDDDAFQVEMLRTIHEAEDDRPDFFVYANRLFDPRREFEGQLGIAYGGPDLSDRNLRILGEFDRRFQAGEIARPPIPWSATGNISSGRTALEYALRGATSFQLHTFFQLPSDQFCRFEGPKTEKALHELYFHPDLGFIVWMWHLARALGLPSDRIGFRDIVGQARRIASDV